MIGSTKNGEYARTVEMLSRMVKCTKKDIAFILYFLYDSSYNGADLKEMADLIINKQI